MPRIAEMLIRWSDLLIIGLAVWRVSSLIVHEEGPWAVFRRLRYWVGERPEITMNRGGDRQDSCTNHFCRGYICVACNSMWLGAIAVVLYMFLPSLTLLFCLPFAFSALAVVIETVVD